MYWQNDAQIHFMSKMKAHFISKNRFHSISIVHCQKYENIISEYNDKIATKLHRRATLNSIDINSTDSRKTIFFQSNDLSDAFYYYYWIWSFGMQ